MQIRRLHALFGRRKKLETAYSRGVCDAGSLLILTAIRKARTRKKTVKVGVGTPWSRLASQYACASEIRAIPANDMHWNSQGWMPARNGRDPLTSSGLSRLD